MGLSQRNSMAREIRDSSRSSCRVVQVGTLNNSSDCRALVVERLLSKALNDYCTNTQW